MNRELDFGENGVAVQIKKQTVQIQSNPDQAVEKQETGRQTRRATMRQGRHIQTYASIDESRATLNGGIRGGFSAVC